MNFRTLTECIVLSLAFLVPLLGKNLSLILGSGINGKWVPNLK